jgi:hypothetical protein
MFCVLNKIKVHFKKSFSYLCLPVQKSQKGLLFDFLIFGKLDVLRNSP